jgi:hypothetical protein
VNFQPTEDQAAFLDALGKLLAQTGADAADGQRCAISARLDAALAESGLLDAAATEGFGPVAAVLLVDQVSRHPAIAEVGASSLVRPLICPDWPRPLAVIVGDARRPARFLCEAQTLLVLGADEARIGRLERGDAAATEDFFAYRMGRLADPVAWRARSVSAGDTADIRRLLCLATAAEIAGALQGALDAVAEHVRNRRQFGRPLGSFQAVQHRLAAAATRISAGRLLTLRAADSARNEDALTALGYAQEGAATIASDLHQFMGAMGLTLEHPLYRWTYRVKLLLSDLGGAPRQLRGLAEALWGEA